MSSQGGTGRRKNNRAIWNRMTEKELMEICHIEWGKGKYLSGQFSQNTLETIVNRLNVTFAPLGLEYTVDAVVTKLKNYKRCWQFHRRMLTSTTGMGWDEDKEKLVMSEDRFIEYCQQNSSYKGFILNGCPAYKKCTELWEPNVATGQAAMSSAAPMSTDGDSAGEGSQDVSFNPFAFMGDSGPGEGSGGGMGKGKGKVPTAAEEREARIKACAKFDSWSDDPIGEEKRKLETKACIDEIKAMPIPLSVKLKAFKYAMKTSFRHVWMALDDDMKESFLLTLD